uniref:Gallinacin-1 alpha n=2 Tax=Gallus gallus TaxID=9031 RepID=GLL1A_CHICK|nr:RecName: Full=Gallinacin-1 alpha; Short=Gal-1 alpha; AltName: Full=Antimicrobial peptide CHP2; AltName: Full=Chicken heterophil peptide 2; Flags: Precursor [Gallus gallus]AAG09211.1 Gal-1 alpha [Gallus gallus]ABI48213.1 Gal 1-alpha [Gallus gallus]ABI48253.1 Gal 1-alpha [Gallus gallus]ADQ74865.1 beta-defensin 1 antimicrobial peptide [Gallus gallus]
MRIVYLLLPFILLLAQGAAGSSQALGRKSDCFRKNGFCAFLKCPYLTLISGKCSRFHLCCKRIWG